MMRMTLDDHVLTMWKIQGERVIRLGALLIAATDGFMRGYTVGEGQPMQSWAYATIAPALLGTSILKEDLYGGMLPMRARDYVIPYALGAVLAYVPETVGFILGAATSLAQRLA